MPYRNTVPCAQDQTHRVPWQHHLQQNLANFHLSGNRSVTYGAPIRWNCSTTVRKNEVEKKSSAAPVFPLQRSRSPACPQAASLVALDRAFSVHLHPESTWPLDVPQRAGDFWNDAELSPCLGDSLLTCLKATPFTESWWQSGEWIPGLLAPSSRHSQ